MKSRMISVVVSIFATTTLFGATVRVSKPAGDGANTITQEIDEHGNVVGESMTCVYVAPKADVIPQELRDSIKAEIDAAVEREKQNPVQVYRLELHTSENGEQAFIVGVDCVKRPVVLVSPDEYDLLTTRLDLMWAYFNSTREGRQKLHGRIVRTEISEERREKAEIHADGFTHTETLPVRQTRPQAEKTSLQARIELSRGEGTEKKPKTMSERQFEMRKRLAERKKHPIKELTVEHDATTGTDKVVK